jgi:CRP-like cAMP-binding protein
LLRGEPLFRRDDAAVGIFEVEEGRVRLCRFDPSGREVLLHLAGPGGLLAEASLFSRTYQCDAIAATNARVRLYPRRALLAEFRSNPRAAQAFAASLAHELMSLRTRLELRNIRSASDRLQSWLALNAGHDGRTVTLKGSVKDLATELGLTHEALYRAVARLVAEGKIVRHEGTIVLKDIAAI